MGRPLRACRVPRKFPALKNKAIAIMRERLRDARPSRSWFAVRLKERDADKARSINDVGKTPME